MCWNRDKCLMFEFKEIDYNNLGVKFYVGKYEILWKLFIIMNLGGLFIFKLCIIYWYIDDIK